VVEARQLAHDNSEHFLHEVIDVLGRHAVPPEPGLNEGRVKIHQPLPRFGIGPVTQSFEETGGRLRHEVLPGKGPVMGAL
jgi:hypothetical protein